MSTCHRQSPGGWQFPVPASLQGVITGDTVTLGGSPIASIVIIVPWMSTSRKSSGIAVISFDFSAQET